MSNPTPLKEVIKQEYIKCVKDPSYFMRKFCMIQHPIQGKIPFDLYDFQEKTIDEIQENAENSLRETRRGIPEIYEISENPS